MSNPEYRKILKNKLNSLNSTILSEPDGTLIVIVAFLVTIGIMAIFSATAQKAMDEGANPAAYILKQLFCLGIGVFVMKFFINFDYKKLAHHSIWIAWGVVILLALVDYTTLGITVNGAKMLLRNDIMSAYKGCKKLFKEFESLDVERQYALVDMCFQLGVKGLSKFRLMRWAIADKDFEGASKACLSSCYAKQTPKRARRIAEVIRTGVWK